MLKVCVVYSFKPSAWVSCQKIVTNLLKAYELNRDQLELTLVDFSNRITDYDFVSSGAKIVQAKPDVVIFLDHQPHPVYFLSWVAREFKEINHKASYVFHLYGDFSLTFKEWATLEPLIEKMSVLWYAASERQKAMLGEFIPAEQIQVCPFPVDPTEFRWKGKRDEAFRKLQGWKKDETIFLFTGRLSRQKRIHQLVETFAEWRAETNANARLVFVGDPDNLGEPWLGKQEYPGEYFHLITKKMETIPEQERKFIHFYGFRPNKELPAFYKAADCLVNISVHNDEDYGMTCAEAQACGLPLILSDWAGFHGFRRPGLEEEVQLVPVKLTPKAKQINLKALKAAFTKMHENHASFDREKIARVSLEWTSVKNAAAIVAENPSKFKLFSKFLPLMHHAAHREFYTKQNTFSDFKKKSFNDLYMKVYRHYVQSP
jgi:glycosyltransferase involved in cell wall biosynthesis